MLLGHLMRYGLVRNASDIETITSSSFQPQDRLNALLKLTEAAGTEGFMLLFMCLFDSRSDTMGHKQAVELLQEHCELEKKREGGGGKGGVMCV